MEYTIASKKLQKIQMQRRGKAILNGNQDNIHQDGYSNMLNKWGTSQDNSEAYIFRPEEIVSDRELIQLYEGNGLFTKIINRPSEEAIKHGFDIDYGDKSIAKYIEDKMDELGFEENFATAQKWARLFGGAIIVMLVDDGRGLEEPLDWKNVRSIDELRVFERPIVQPDYTSMYSYNFEDSLNSKRPPGQPMYYDVFSLYGYFRVHYTRCLIFRNGRLPEHTTNALYRHWGIPEYVKIKRALRETVTSHGDGVKLLERCVQAIYKMKNLSNLLGTGKGEDEVIKRMQVIDMARGILNSLVIDADGEDYDFKTLQMSGVKDIIDSTCNMLSAVTDIPQTILFGRSPAGENSTGESDFENFYSMIDGIHKLNMKPNSRIVIDLILIEGKRCGKIRDIPSYKVKFASLWSMSETEQAAVEQTKATTEQIKAQTFQIYVDMQALDSTEVRDMLSKKEGFIIQESESEDDFDLPDDMMDIDDFKNRLTKGKISNISNENTMDEEDVAAGAVIVIKDGMILAGERSDGTGLCGPGGKIEEGETPEDTAVREAFEEFSISTHKLLPVGVNKASLELYMNSKVFLCTDFTGLPEPDGKEMTSAKWYTLEELFSKTLFPPFMESLELLLSDIEEVVGIG